MTRIALVSVALACVVSCPGPAGPGQGRPAGGSAINPGACGKIDTSPVGRKIYAFLVASSELDSETKKLEATVRSACTEMAAALEIPAEGDTAALCDRVAAELEANLEVSISQEQRLVTRTKPPVCETKIDFAAEVAAECEARVGADVAVRCEGVCSGTCTGGCDGACTATAADGSCAGVCEGTCRGRCSGGCRGHADVEASAECKAAAEVRAGVRTECSEPEVEVVTENVTVVDASKLERATRAISVGLPRLLRAAARAEIVAKALGHWVKTAADLAAAGGEVIGELGRQGACVAVQLAAAAAAAANIRARIDVSIKVSARVSASAGAQ
jgi:modification target Cys-rich repeat protein